MSLNPRGVLMFPQQTLIFHIKEKILYPQPPGLDLFWLTAFPKFMYLNPQRTRGLEQRRAKARQIQEPTPQGRDLQDTMMPPSSSQGTEHRRDHGTCHPAASGLLVELLACDPSAMAASHLLCSSVPLSLLLPSSKAAGTRRQTWIPSILSAS